MERVEMFLNRKEINQNYLHYVNGENKNMAVDIKNGSFGWIENQFIL